MSPTGLRWLIVLDKSPVSHRCHANYMESLMSNEAIAVLTWMWLRAEKDGDVDLAVVPDKNKIAPFKNVNRESGFDAVMRVFLEVCSLL